MLCAGASRDYQANCRLGIFAEVFAEHDQHNFAAARRRTCEIGLGATAFATDLRSHSVREDRRVGVRGFWVDENCIAYQFHVRQRHEPHRVFVVVLPRTADIFRVWIAEKAHKATSERAVPKGVTFLPTRRRLPQVLCIVVVVFAGDVTTVAPANYFNP